VPTPPQPPPGQQPKHKLDPIEVAALNGVRVLLRPSPNEPECNKVREERSDDRIFNSNMTNDFCPSLRSSRRSQVFFTTNRVVLEGDTRGDPKKTVEGFLSKNDLREGWNKVYLAVKSSSPGSGKSNFVASLNGVSTGVVPYAPDLSRYLVLNGGIGRELGGVVWHQGVVDYAGGGGGVEERMKSPFPEDVGRKTREEYGRGGDGCKGEEEEVRRFVKDLDGMRLMECMGSGGGQGMIKSYLLYSLDYPQSSIPYYLLHHSHTAPPPSYTTTNTGLCTLSSTILKQPTLQALRGYSSGSSRPLNALTLGTLSETEERHEYFQSTAGAAPFNTLRLAQSYYWGAPGIPQNHPRAFDLFREAGDQHGPQQGEALYNLGVMYANGQAPPPHNHNAAHPDIRAMEVWERAADIGDVSSTVGLAGIHLSGRKLSNGTEIPRNTTLARIMYTKAAISGSRDAMELIAKGHLHSWWAGRNLTEAYRWYAKCAVHGKEACVAEVGFGVGMREGWISEWEREREKEGGGVLDGGKRGTKGIASRLVNNAVISI